MPPLLEVLGTSEWLSNPSKLARKGKADEDVGWGCWGTEENLLNIIYLISWIFYSLIFSLFACQHFFKRKFKKRLIFLKYHQPIK